MHQFDLWYLEAKRRISRQPVAFVPFSCCQLLFHFTPNTTEASPTAERPPDFSISRRDAGFLTTSVPVVYRTHMHTCTCTLARTTSSLANQVVQIKRLRPLRCSHRFCASLTSLSASRFVRFWRRWWRKMISALIEDDSTRGRLSLPFVDASFTSYPKDLDKVCNLYCVLHYLHGLLRELQFFKTYK